MYFMGSETLPTNLVHPFTLRVTGITIITIILSSNAFLSISEITLHFLE